MLQQIIAFIVIAFFVTRLIKQRRKKQITTFEFVFWLSFFIIAALAILFIKQIDLLLSSLGFTASGIDLLLYIAVVTLFYMVIRIRINQEKQERNITKLVRGIAILSASESKGDIFEEE